MGPALALTGPKPEVEVELLTAALGLGRGVFTRGARPLIVFQQQHKAPPSSACYPIFYSKHVTRFPITREKDKLLQDIGKESCWAVLRLYCPEMELTFSGAGVFIHMKMLGPVVHLWAGSPWHGPG